MNTVRVSFGDGPFEKNEDAARWIEQLITDACLEAGYERPMFHFEDEGTVFEVKAGAISPRGAVRADDQADLEWLRELYDKVDGLPPLRSSLFGREFSVRDDASIEHRLGDTIQVRVGRDVGTFSLDDLDLKDPAGPALRATLVTDA